MESTRQSEQSVHDPDVTVASYEGTPPSAQRPSSANSPPPVLPSDIAIKLRTIDDCLKDDLILDAHAELSEIYWKHPELRSTIDDRIRETASLIFTSNEQQFGSPHLVEYGETLQAIAKQYEVPWQYLALLNRVTPEKLQAGQELKVVRGPFGAVVDLSAFTLTVHAHGWYVNKYRIGTGRDHKTPLGEFVVEDKLENPTWYNPDGGIVEPDDPENPLGEYWLGLGNHIGIHGTNDPSTIGRAASRGCIHLGDSEIEEVFSLLSTGSKVLIRK
jgi:lipoprotein-anchoring transpeptidase ErfK/SrfK